MMNLWKYYEWEDNKYGCGMNYALKITNVNSEMKSVVVGIHYYTSTENHLLTFALNKQWRKFTWTKDYYERWWICAQHSAGCNNQFVT